jgi:hypothetical protein
MARRVPLSSEASASAIVRAYQLVGFTPERDMRYVEINRQLRALLPDIVDEAISNMARLGGTVLQDDRSELLTVNDEFTVSICIARCQETVAGTLRWKIRFDTGLSPDVIVALRMDRENEVIQDLSLPNTTSGNIHDEVRRESAAH